MLPLKLLPPQEPERSKAQQLQQGTFSPSPSQRCPYLPTSLPSRRKTKTPNPKPEFSKLLGGNSNCKGSILPAWRGGFLLGRVGVNLVSGERVSV